MWVRWFIIEQRTPLAVKSTNLFRDSEFLQDKKISGKLASFLSWKISNPFMSRDRSDRALQGIFKGYLHYHLDDDVLLLYKIEQSIIVLSGIVRHKDIAGKRQLGTLQRLQNARLVERA